MLLFLRSPVRLEDSSSDDDLPRVIHAYATLEMQSRNGQPLLSGTIEEYTRFWYRAEQACLIRSAEEEKKRLISVYGLTDLRL